MCFGKGDPNSKQGAPSGDNGSSPDYSSSSVSNRDKDESAERDDKTPTPVSSRRPRARTDVRRSERSLFSRAASNVRQSLFPRG